MKKKVAIRALGFAMASAMVATSVGTVPGMSIKTPLKVEAAGGSAIYVDDVNYYNSDYDAKNAYDGKDLGCTYTKEKTVFKVWSPEAESMTLNVYATGSDEEEGARKLGQFDMKKGDRGVWEYTWEGDHVNAYYTYRAVIDGQSYGEAVDPYAKAVGVNGERGMVVDLDSTDPEGWDKEYKRTKTSLSDVVVWEVHIRDFSIDVSSGVSEKNRGKYKAFTEKTTVNGEGKVSSCVDYLKKMGVTHVQLLPTFDYEGVDEKKADNNLSKDNYNWGYNPLNYNAPEGSYSSDPYNGNTRIKEMKEMIQALHDAGIKVIMDVVYNHTGPTEKSSFNKLMPDYYYMLTKDASGKVTYDDESGCGNATRSASVMYDKFMRESLKYWADEYHIDGFRFDLMGVHEASTMNAIRKDMDEAFGEDTIVMYGEGWTGGGYKETSAYKDYCRNLDDGIGYFNDQIRDAIKGETGPEKVDQIGFVQQNYGLEGKYTDHEKLPTSVFGGIMGSVGMNDSKWWMWRAYWSDTSNRALSYDSCHDNMTVWDKFVQSFGETDFNTTDSKYTDMSRLTAGYLLTSHGGTFLHAGEEFARTKQGEHNSYNVGDYVNKLDWNRVVSYGAINAYYQGMISVRKAFSGFRNIYTETGNIVPENTETGYFNEVNGNNLTEIKEFTEVVPGKNDAGQIQSTVNSIGYYLSNDKEKEWSQVAVLLNNTTETKKVDLNAADGSSQWVLVSNGKKASVKGVSITEGNTVIVPGKSVVVAVPKNTFDSVSFAEEDFVVTGLPDESTSDEGNKEPQTPTGGAVVASGVSITGVNVSPSKYQVVNKDIKITAKVAGGEGSYRYRFYVYDDKDVLVKSSSYTEKNTFTWKPTKAGKYTFEVAVLDKAGSLDRAQKSLTVISKKPAISSIVASKKSVKAGNKITFTVKASGGKKAYTYQYVVKDSKGKTVKSSANTKNSSWTWKTAKKGTYSVTVNLKDSLGLKATKKLSGIKVK